MSAIQKGSVETVHIRAACTESGVGMTVFDTVTCPKWRRCSRGISNDEGSTLTVPPGCQISGSFHTESSGNSVASSAVKIPGRRRSGLKGQCSSDSWMSAKQKGSVEKVHIRAACTESGVGMTMFDTGTCRKWRRCSRGISNDEGSALKVAPGCQMSGSFYTESSLNSVASSAVKIPGRR
ncbi:hypothetical protein MRX96_003242 [Rhipicephalus microplus]